MAELTPLDILAKTFGKSLRGYDPQSVHEFLSLMAAQVEELLRDRGELKQLVYRLENELAEFRERESALRNALVAAQATAERTVENARNDAQKIIDEGQILSDRLVQDSHDRAQKIEVIIGDLRSRRREARTELIRLAELLRGLASDDEQREREERDAPQLALLHRSEGTGTDGGV